MHCYDGAVLALVAVDCRGGPSDEDGRLGVMERDVSGVNEDTVLLGPGAPEHTEGREAREIGREAELKALRGCEHPGQLCHALLACK